MHLEYSEQSIIDLDNIINYIAKDSKNRALQYIDKMKSKIELLVHTPNIGVLCKEKKIKLNCKIFIFEHYLVFYTIKENSIQIKRVLHSSVNYTNKLIEGIK
jgi:plasmid stabilization system protein ParE